MFHRLLAAHIQKKMFSGKAIIVVGARQTGKTTLSQKLCPPEETLFLNGDNPSDRELLHEKDLSFLQKVVGKKKYVLIDEGQKMVNIGQTLKLLVDHYKAEKQILVTGSSALHILDEVQESLTGRKYVFQLFPLSAPEIYADDIRLFFQEIETLLLYGSYPEVVMQTSFSEKRRLIEEISTSSLYKDILEFQQVKNPYLLRDLLKALALQVGGEVSYHELSRLLGIDKKTVERYVDLLEKNFVIFRLPPYTDLKRKEISKMKKIFFTDLGVRNALISNFSLLKNRNDVGALWENFLAIERKKTLLYGEKYVNTYFWRTYSGSEVDWVEEGDGKLDGYEFKWNPKKKGRRPAQFLEYQGSSYSIITPENAVDFLW